VANRDEQGREPAAGLNSSKQEAKSDSATMREAKKNNATGNSSRCATLIQDLRLKTNRE
jgi:hypothetical protein